MRTALFLFVLFLLAENCTAQHWRIEGAFGAVVPADLNPDKPVVPIPSPYLTYAPMSVPTEPAIIHAIGGLKLMRRDSAIEYGIGISAFSIHFKGLTAADTGYPARTVRVDQQTYLARPAIPVRAFLNYCHHRSKSYAFIGLSTGILFVRGRDMQDVNTLKYYQDYTIYFHNAMGYTVGGQLGFRRAFGKFDAGAELSANFMHLALTQGTSNTAFTYNLFYFPVQAYVGYSF